MYNHSHVLIDSHVHMHTYLHTLKHTFIQSHGHTPHIHKYIDIISQTHSTYSVHTHSHAFTHEFSQVPEFGPWRAALQGRLCPYCSGSRVPGITFSCWHWLSSVSHKLLWGLSPCLPHPMCRSFLQGHQDSCSHSAHFLPSCKLWEHRRQRLPIVTPSSWAHEPSQGPMHNWKPFKTVFWSSRHFSMPQEQSEQCPG